MHQTFYSEIKNMMSTSLPLLYMSSVYIQEAKAILQIDETKDA